MRSAVLPFSLDGETVCELARARQSNVRCAETEGGERATRSTRTGLGEWSLLDEIPVMPGLCNYVYCICLINMQYIYRLQIRGCLITVRTDQLIIFQEYTVHALPYF